MRYFVLKMQSFHSIVDVGLPILSPFPFALSPGLKPKLQTTDVKISLHANYEESKTRTVILHSLDMLR